MRYHLAVILTILPFLSSNAKDIMSDTPPISITLKCVENNDCFYDGKDMSILIAIKNEGKININFPFEFLRKSGPIVKLIAADTGKITYGRRGLANPTLKMKFTKISPGETIFMQTYLYKEQIESFKEKKSEHHS